MNTSRHYCYISPLHKCLSLTSQLCELKHRLLTNYSSAEELSWCRVEKRNTFSGQSTINTLGPHICVESEVGLGKAPHSSLDFD